MDFRLIAEIGVNHLGSVKLAKEMIDAGSRCGIDFFKFQIFTLDEMKEVGWKETDQWFDYMSHCILSKEEHTEIREYCHKMGATYFASAFGEESLEITLSLDVEIIKLASRSVYDDDGNIADFAKKVYALGIPTITSLGFRKPGWEIPSHDHNSNLYCVSKYPTLPKDIKWPSFKSKDDFGRRKFSGFSDHTVGASMPTQAINLGATIIEKHFTLDKRLFGPDQCGSAEPEEMKEIYDYGCFKNN